MSYTINQGVVTGNITRDAKIKTTQSGKTIAEFSIAVNRAQKSQSGEWDKVVSFFDVVYFCTDKFAALLNRGVAVAVQYELRQDRWDDKETGKARSKVELFASNVLLMGGKHESTETRPEDPEPPQFHDNTIPF